MEMPENWDQQTIKNAHKPISVTFENMKFTNAGKGTSVMFKAKLTVNNCIYINNQGKSCGPAIASFGTLILKKNSFINNKAPNLAGGAIEIVEGVLTASDCIFTKNSASNGGAISIGSSKASLTKCTFDNNNAGKEGGGAICIMRSSTVTMNKCIFNKNIATAKGGAISIYSSTLKIDDSKLSKNIEGKKYKAIYKDKKSKLTTKNVKITPKDGSKV